MRTYWERRSATITPTPWFLASTRKSFTDANTDLHQGLLEAFFDNGARDIGTAHRLALSRLLEGEELEDPGIRATKADTAAMSILLGDPAWPIPKLDKT